MLTQTDLPLGTRRELPSTCGRPSLTILPHQIVLPHPWQNEIAERRRSLVIKKCVGQVCLADESTVSSFTCISSSSDAKVWHEMWKMI